MAQKHVCSKIQSNPPCTPSGSNKSPRTYDSLPSRGNSSAAAMANDATSSPITSVPALARTRTSCPKPQPGTMTRPEIACVLNHSTSAGCGAPFSQGVSPWRYRSSHSTSHPAATKCDSILEFSLMFANQKGQIPCELQLKIAIKNLLQGLEGSYSVFLAASKPI